MFILNWHKRTFCPSVEHICMFVYICIFVYLYIDNATFFLDEGFARSSRSLIHLCWSLFFIEVAVLEACNSIKETPTLALSWEYCEIFKSSFLWNTFGGCFCFALNKYKKIAKKIIFHYDCPVLIWNHGQGM